MKLAAVPVAAMLLLLCAVRSAQAADPEPSPTPFTWIDASASTDHLNNRSPDWHNSTITIATKAGRRALYGSISSVQRFGSSDAQYTSGAYVPSSANTILNAEVAVSPTHRILPSADLLLTLDHRLAAGWGYSVGARGRLFPAITVLTELFSIDRYWKTYHAAYTLGNTQISNVGGSSLGHTLVFTKYYGREQMSAVTAFASAGREAENVGGPILVSSVAGGGLSGVHWFDGATAVTWSASVTRQGNIYTRSELQFGIRRRL